MQSVPRRDFTSLEDGSDSIVDWFQRNVRTVVIACVVLAAAAVGLWLYQRASASSAARAEAEYFQARQAALSGNVPLAQADLERVITRYGGTSAAAQASMTLAQLYYGQGKHAEGLEVLSAAAGRADDQFRASVTKLMAAGLEGQGDLAGAAERYLQASEQARFEVESVRLRAEAARVFASAGQTDRAVEILSEIADDDSSPFAPEARVRLGELQAAPIAAQS